MPRSSSLVTCAGADCLTQLNSLPTGLDAAEAIVRRQQAGPNEIPRVPGTPLTLKLVGQFTHLMALLLWGAAGLAMVAGMTELAVAIATVNLLNGVFSFWQEFRAQKATEALQKMLPRWARVLRNSREQKIPAEDVVPGDILLLGEGEHIAADARLLWEADFRSDQSILTGESRAVKRTADPSPQASLAWIEQPNLVFAGATVASGSARAVAFATGGLTEFGRIAHLTQSIPETPSPLQVEMARLTRTLSLFVIGVGLVFFGLAVWLAGMRPAQGFLFSLGMIVAFVPEGLLPTVTLSLAMGVQRMARRNALVKKLSAVETLGCTNVICTDKTGTLTQNQMTVRELYTGGRRIQVGGAGYEPRGEFRVDGVPLADPLEQLGELLRVAALCNDARLVEPSEDSPAWTILGDPTEGALQTLARKASLQRAEEQPRWGEIPFESQRMRMSTLYREEGGLRAYVKGAPRRVLEVCQGLSEADLARTLEVNDEMAGQGLRVLAVATRLLERDPVAVTVAEVETKLTFVGLVGMHDPPRPEVAEAVEVCHRAGIRILMLTGDYGLTGLSIARQLGLVRSDRARVLIGSELEALTSLSLQELLRSPEELIFARVAPEQKLRVVQALQALGQVVAVTGDGVNDAPALRQADIGVAMGRSGSDVAREAADMVLTDDSFASIVAAIEEGRAVYANLRRFVSYIFTSNLPEALPFVLYAFSQGHFPLALTIMQILAIDLGTDMLPALALGAEPPERGIMARPPRDRREPLVTRALLARVGYLGALASVAMLVSFLLGFWLHGWQGWSGEGPGYRIATAMAFATVVASQVGNLLAHRTEVNSVFTVGLRGNRLIGIGILVETLFLLGLLYVPWLASVFGTAPLGWREWLCVLAWTPSLLLADEIRKAWLRHSLAATA